MDISLNRFQTLVQDFSLNITTSPKKVGYIFGICFSALASCYLIYRCLKNRYVTILSTRAGHLLLDGRVEEAKTQCFKALVLNPKHFDALLIDAEILALEGKLEDAEAQCAKALKQNPNPYAIVIYAQILLQQNKLVEAETECNKALLQLPNQPMVLELLADINEKRRSAV